MDRDLLEKLKVIRKVTDGRFSAANGYDARKPMSYRRRRTIKRYFDTYSELTSRPNQVYRPKKGEKTEVFQYTGQEKFPRFKYAYVRKFDPEMQFDFVFDKSKPKGSRFRVFEKETDESSWHIPARLFWGISDEDFGTDEERISAYNDILEEYAPDAETFMIEAGDHLMWGQSGNSWAIAQKLNQLFKNYGAMFFDARKRDSSHIKNWFRGVTAFRTDTMANYIRIERERHSYNRSVKYGKYYGLHTRLTRDGVWRQFYEGEEVEMSYSDLETAIIEQYKRRLAKQAARKKRSKRDRIKGR